MSHELEIIDGEAQMAYVGQVPWHGLCTELEPGATPLEMMKAAGLDWEVRKLPAFYQLEDGTFVRAGKKEALLRNTDDKFMDIVSENWNEIQNLPVFEFFNEYCDQGGLTMETAGSLKDGKIVWALAKTTNTFSILKGRDEVQQYILLSNPHQFGQSMDARIVQTRVVCNNTFAVAMGEEAKIGISVDHRSEFDPEAVKAALVDAAEKANTFKEMSSFLATKRYTDEDLFNYFNQVFPKSGKAAMSLEEIMENWRGGDKDGISRNAKKALELVHTQPGSELGEGTWWQAFNTVTFMTNHVMGHNNGTRMHSTWYGQNKSKAVNALGTAIDFAEMSAAA